MPAVCYQGKPIVYLHKVNRRLRQASIRVSEQGIILRSPGLSAEAAQALVIKHSQWIVARLAEIEARRHEAVQKAQTFVFLGQTYPVQVSCRPGYAPRAELTEQALLLSLPETPTPELVEAMILEFYRAQAKRYMTPRLQAWSERMDLPFTGLQFKKLRRRWGSCTADNKINLNLLAMKLAPELIELLLVHELAHIRHKDHSGRFWALVGEYIPNYRELSHALRHAHP